MASALHPHCSHLCHCSGRTIRLQLHPTSPVPPISTLPTPAPTAHSPLPSQYPQHRHLQSVNDHSNVPHNRLMPSPLQFHHLHRLPLRANTPRDIPHHSTNPPTLLPQYRHLQRPPPSLHANVSSHTSRSLLTIPLQPHPYQPTPLLRANVPRSTFHNRLNLLPQPSTQYLHHHQSLHPPRTNAPRNVPHNRINLMPIPPQRRQLRPPPRPLHASVLHRAPPNCHRLNLLTTPLQHPHHPQHFLRSVPQHRIYIGTTPPQRRQYPSPPDPQRADAIRHRCLHLLATLLQHPQHPLPCHPLIASTLHQRCPTTYADRPPAIPTASSSPAAATSPATPARPRNALPHPLRPTIPSHTYLSRLLTATTGHHHYIGPLPAACADLSSAAPTASPSSPAATSLATPAPARPHNAHPNRSRYPLAACRSPPPTSPPSSPNLTSSPACPAPSLRYRKPAWARGPSAA